MPFRSPPPLPNLKKLKTLLVQNQQLIAESAIGRTECLRQPLNSMSPRLRNNVRIQSKRDSWVAMAELCADGGDACAPVNQRRGDTVPERMKAREWNPERREQRT